MDAIDLLFFKLMIKTKLKQYSISILFGDMIICIMYYMYMYIFKKKIN